MRFQERLSLNEQDTAERCFGRSQESQRVLAQKPYERGGRVSIRSEVEKMRDQLEKRRNMRQAIGDQTT